MDPKSRNKPKIFESTVGFEPDLCTASCMYLYTVAFSCGQYGCCSPLLVAFGNVVIPVAILHLLIEYQILITIHNVFVSHGALQI